MTRDNGIRVHIVIVGSFTISYPCFGQIMQSMVNFAFQQEDFHEQFFIIQLFHFADQSSYKIQCFMVSLALKVSIIAMSAYIPQHGIAKSISCCMNREGT